MAGPEWVKLEDSRNAWARKLLTGEVLVAPHIPARRYWVLNPEKYDLDFAVAYDLDFTSLGELDAFVLSWLGSERKKP